MKVGEGGVQCNRYNGRCINNELEFQRLFEHCLVQGEREHAKHFFIKLSFMKDDLNDEMPNGTPKILIPYDGVLNQDGVSKSGDKPKEDYVTHF